MAKIKHVGVGFTQISNVIFDDWRLSFKEIGLYCNMMKFPDNWEFSVRNLATRHKDKKGSINSALSKLIEYGYIVRRQQTRDERGFYGAYDYELFWNPFDNPSYIPCPNKNDFDYSNDEHLTTESSSACSEYPTDSNRSTDNPSTDNPSTDSPSTENPSAEKRPTTNTIAKNTISNNTFEEEVVTHARVDVERFRSKITGRFYSDFFVADGDEKTQSEMTKALNAILNALPDITNEDAINVTNDCSAEDAYNLWKWVYRNMFSTSIGEIVRNDIDNIHAYLVTLIPKRLGTSYGLEPFASTPK